MLETILATILATGASAVLLAYLSRTLLRHWLDKDLDSYKANLGAEHARWLEQHKASLAPASLEHQVRFTRLHERRARIIARVYAKLDQVYLAMREWTRAMHIGQRRDMSKLRDSALTARDDFVEYYWRNVIWLERGICEAISDLIGQLDAPKYDFMIDVNDKGFPNDRKAWLAASEKLAKDIPKARQAIETRFRVILGVEEPSGPDV
jgi:hypothetical protein